MEPDKLQQAWQAQASQTRVTIDADLLLMEVQRHQRNFEATIFWRDFVEVVIALIMLPLWFFLGLTLSLPWTWYLSVPVIVWSAGFMLVYRRRHKQKPSQPDEPLIPCVERSIIETQDQIWLLRNVFWWNLLPPTITILAFFAQVSWSLRATGEWFALISFVGLALFLLAIYGFVYYVNQRAVRVRLEPRRQELLSLLATLSDETTGEGTSDRVALPALPFADGTLATPCNSPARVAFSTIVIAIGVLLIVTILLIMAHTDKHISTGEGESRMSPFAAVRWQESQPEVKVDGEWFKLVSLDGIAAEDMVAFSQKTYRNKWRKRFEEDLVELLTEMKHPPGDKVTLVVESLTTSETRTLEDVPMTHANRRAIRNAVEAREESEP